VSNIAFLSFKSLLMILFENLFFSDSVNSFIEIDVMLIELLFVNSSVFPLTIFKNNFL